MLGRVKDIYFDDVVWEARHLVISPEGRHSGRGDLLVPPAQIERIEGLLQVKVSSGDLPSANCVLPVCKQYAALAYASPGSRRFGAGADPHLRSVRAVTGYRVEAAGEMGGNLADFLFEDESWEIRFLQVERLIGGKKLEFYVLPQTVERFTWATGTVVLSTLQPVLLAGREDTAAEVQAA
jgi:hypothetical protein